MHCFFNILVQYIFLYLFLIYWIKPSIFIPPVALAILLRSTFLQRLTARAPASTKYFRHKSSIPPVVRITLAPAPKIFSILSFVISYSLEEKVIETLSFHVNFKKKFLPLSYRYMWALWMSVYIFYLCRTPSNCSGLSIKTWTPIFIFVFCKLKSKQAIFAPNTFLVIATIKTKKNKIKVLQIKL